MTGARTPPTRRKVSTPLVLAASSGMVMVGLVAVLSIQSERSSRREQLERAAIATRVMDDRTAEAAAESYLDAWRRRAWDDCASVATGAARDAALHKKQLDAAMDTQDRAMAEEVWRRLAAAPLRVEFRAAENIPNGVRLDGVAEYQFMGTPYRREVEWDVLQEGEHHRVVRMEHGAVLSDLPPLLRGSE